MQTNNHNIISIQTKSINFVQADLSREECKLIIRARFARILDLVASQNSEKLWDHSTLDSSWPDSSWLDSSWLDSSWPDSSWLDSSWLDSSWLDSSLLDSSWPDSSWPDSSWLDSSSSALLLRHWANFGMAMIIVHHCCCCCCVLLHPSPRAYGMAIECPVCQRS